MMTRDGYKALELFLCNFRLKSFIMNSNYLLQKEKSRFSTRILIFLKKLVFLFILNRILEKSRLTQCVRWKINRLRSKIFRLETIIRGVHFTLYLLLFFVWCQKLDRIISKVDTTFSFYDS